MHINTDGLKQHCCLVYELVTVTARVVRLNILTLLLLSPTALLKAPLVGPAAEPESPESVAAGSMLCSSVRGSLPQPPPVLSAKQPSWRRWGFFCASF
eukprot:747527-Hanusia_phi.AAC.3